MMGGFLKISGKLILRLVYGKKQAEKIFEEFGCIIFPLSLANIFWLLSLLFIATGITGKDTILCIIMAIGYPVAIAIWTIIARKMQNSKPTTDATESQDTESQDAE